MSPERQRIPLLIAIAAVLLGSLGWIPAQEPSGAERVSAAPQAALPVASNSVRFALIGDNGTGARPQYEVGEQMVLKRKAFPFEFVLMLGDNLYGGKTPADYKRKFEDPYKPLLDDGVKFYASLGNHDDPNEAFYKPFNMDGKRYYSFKSGNAEFFALDSTYMDREQLAWIDSKLQGSGAAWKICFFHHPLYSNGRFHGSDLDLRARLGPLLEKYGVSVVFSGHDHVYERIKPQNGVYYFVIGNSGELRPRNLRSSPLTEKGFDTDQTFLLAEIAGDELHFQAISRAGKTIDAGVIERPKKPKPTPPSTQ